jgi:hypothetical protein
MTARGRALLMLAGMAVLVAGWVGFVTRWSGPAGAGPERARFGVAGAQATNLGAFQDQLLIWAPGGLSPREVGVVRDSTSVAAISAVRTGLLAVASGRRGHPVVPVEAMAVDPEAYAAAVGKPGRRLAAMLDRGVVLSRTGARLRGLQLGRRLLLASGRPLRVSGVVDDALLGGYEVAMDRFDGRRFGVTRTAYLLVRPRGKAAATEAAVRGLLRRRALRFAEAGKRPVVRGGDPVLPLAAVKARFGEFALPSLGGGGPDPTWTRANLVTGEVPLLGRVRCHRLVIGDLAAAMTELQRQRLGGLVDAAASRRHGGCWSRAAVRDRHGRLSRHAWGIAVTLDPAGRGAAADQRLVRVMAGHGFAWGGQWLRPAGGSFEWVGAGA